MFINSNHLITPALSASFDRISKQIDGFYFGRFDLRVKTIEDLEAGNIQILELNGCVQSQPISTNRDTLFYRRRRTNAPLVRHLQNQC